MPEEISFKGDVKALKKPKKREKWGMFVVLIPMMCESLFDKYV